jgi:HlyD family secretion protein
MKRKRNLKIALVLALIISVGFILSRCGGEAAETTYKFDKISRGDIVNMISCSGTLEAVGTVEVGTQVSGVLDRIYVDFNDKVRKNQVLAVLDTVLLKAQVIEAQANYDKVKAQLQEAEADLNRNKPLFEKGLISESEFLPNKINLKIQQASLKSAEAILLRADRNLKYAVIRSPIDGTVIQRSVEEGQTVAASLQAPTLFIIAEDLSQMEIHAQVDESDIGQIKNGQKAVFEVQAYPDKRFEGVIRQVRLQPEVVQNVVNYTVVVDADNKDGLLLPGMTATVDFYVEELKNILLVPNTALRFQPAPEQLEAFQKRMRDKFTARKDTSAAPGGRNSQQNGIPGAGRQGSMPKDLGRVWLMDNDGNLELAFFKMGSTDGKYTEIKQSRTLKEGVRVITGIIDQNGDLVVQDNQNTRRRFGPRLF